MRKNLQKIFDKAKALPLFRAVDASGLKPADRRELAAAGLSFTVDRNRRILAMYPQARRADDLRAAVMEKRKAL